MPGRQQIPSLQLASGTTDERDLSYNLTTIGSVFYNTDTSNVEVRHEDPSNNVGWRDLVMNNKEQIDISGNVDISGNLGVSDKIICETAPVGVNDLCNKAYVDLPRDGEVVNRQYTYYRDVGAYNQGGSGYVNISQLQVIYTPLYTGSHFKVTLNAHIGQNTLSSGGTSYCAYRLYRNYTHLTEASGTTTGLTSVNANCWMANNRISSNVRNLALQHGVYIDTAPTFLAGGTIVYSIAARSAAWNTSSGGSNQNKFYINRMETNDARFQRPASFMMVEEIYNAP